ncbi:hypothetical protein KIN20_028003 [Parelaphostrongylus tenuis]|uniref:Uncharacterized protein n=1 Tax=Parelaphostrongylus tenuis TaxID=148309 RepID=A0AAD5WEL9_PARTN|nr:hypothetical protein KIN20_028003 [Parelaphostrongylus tenuis]
MANFCITAHKYLVKMGVGQISYRFSIRLLNTTQKALTPLKDQMNSVMCRIKDILLYSISTHCLPSNERLSSSDSLTEETKMSYEGCDLARLS